MTIVRITSIDDPRVAGYRNLRDRTLRGESLFVTEGSIVTLRLLRSAFGVDSVLVADAFLDEIAPAVGGRAPIYVGSEQLLLDVVGFPFHRGVLGAGRRPQRTPQLDELLAAHDPNGPLRLVICPEITKPENMGLIFRTCGAFGVDLLLLGQRCCDPFSRRCLRVSMGAALGTPFTKTADLQADLRRLREHWKVELLAAVVDPQAEPLAGFSFAPRTGILLGNEFAGLGPEWLACCDHRVTIPMHANVDSLNLGVAAGVFVYEMQRARGDGEAS